MTARIEEGDGSLQVLEAVGHVTAEGDARSDDEPPLHFKAGIVLLLGDLEELLADRRRLAELDRELGLDQVAFYFHAGARDPKRARHNIELFAHEVMPEFQTKL